MKKWPKDKTETVPYEDLIGPVREALEYAYALRRRNEGEDIPYEGYPHFEPTIPAFDEGLSEDVLSYQREQGRDALDTILNMAFVLGFEQGQRHYKGSLEEKVSALKRDTELFRRDSLIDQLEERLADSLGYDQISEIYENDEDLHPVEPHRWGYHAVGE